MVRYKVIYFHKGYHQKIYELIDAAVSAFKSIPCDYSPQLKKVSF